jgi:hypothetical protein
LGAPGETAQRFVPNAFSTSPGARLYRTGDRVRRRASGELEYLDRLDRQVQIRGHRIEPSEVERALEQHPGVLQAAVVTEVSVAAGFLKLLAFYKTTDAGSPRSEELRGWLAKRLPIYMVPAALVELAELPTTNRGKIDYPALRRARSPAENQNPSPSTEASAEESMTQAWCDVLGLESVRLDDHFVELGGDSLVAVRLADRASRLGYRCDPQDIFDNPTVSRLLDYLRRLGA